MASNVPVVRRVAWLSVLLQLIIIALFTYLFHLAGFSEPFVFAALSYSLLAFILRKSIANEHRTGMKLVKQHKFAEALSLFKRSVDYFTKHKWVDDYRSLTLLSASGMSYREMGLCNIAFCYSQTGNGEKAIEYYELALKEFPGNGLAVAGLNMLRSVQSQPGLPAENVSGKD